MSKPHLRLVAPAIVNRTVTPRRAKNSELRSREYLTEHEIEALMDAARKNRHGQRDATMILIAFRHGLRASELVGLRWEQVEYSRAVLHVRRVKGGTPSVHPLSGVELRALRRLQRESTASPFVFVSERGAPFTTAGFARHDGAGRRRGWAWAQGPSPHAPACLRIRSGQRRARYAVAASVSRAQQHSAHGPVHRASAGPVQAFLAGLDRDDAEPRCYCGAAFMSSAVLTALMLSRTRRCWLPVSR